MDGALERLEPRTVCKASPFGDLKPMPNPSKSAAKTPAAKAAPEWASLVESGAGLSEVERSTPDPMDAPIEKLPAQPFSITAEVRKRPVLYIGLGALAVAGLAAFLGRGAIGRAARPIVVRTVKPMLIRAAARRPFEAVKLAARNPRVAMRLAAEGLRSTRRG